MEGEEVKAFFIQSEATIKEGYLAPEQMWFYPAIWIMPGGWIFSHSREEYIEHFKTRIGHALHFYFTEVLKTEPPPSISIEKGDGVVVREDR